MKSYYIFQDIINLFVNGLTHYIYPIKHRNMFNNKFVRYSIIKFVFQKFLPKIFDTMKKYLGMICNFFSSYRKTIIIDDIFSGTKFFLVILFGHIWNELVLANHSKMLQKLQKNCSSFPENTRGEFFKLAKKSYFYIFKTSSILFKISSFGNTHIR